MDKALEVVNEETGEITDLPTAQEFQQRSVGLATKLSPPDPYVGASEQPLTEAEIAVVTRHLGDDEVMIKPTGELYVAQVIYRRILNEAFKPGGWALLPRGPWVKQEGVIYREYALYVGGRFISEAVGAQHYYDNNAQMTYADATEGAKSDALKKACKDIGVASECWDKAFCARFVREHCVQVWVKDKQKGNITKWRRKDFEPFYNESGIVKPKAGKAESPTTQTQTGNKKAAPKSEPASSGSSGKKATVNSGDVRTITEAQKRMIFALIGKSDQVGEDDVKTVFEVEHIIDLPMSAMNDVLDYIKTGRVKGEAVAATASDPSKESEDREALAMDQIKEMLKIKEKIGSVKFMTVMGGHGYESIDAIPSQKVANAVLSDLKTIS